MATIILLIHTIRDLNKEIREKRNQAIESENIIENLDSEIYDLNLKIESLIHRVDELYKENWKLKKEKKELEEIKIFEMEATAYTDDEISQGKWVGQTATGRKPQVGVVAVDPKVIPLETLLYVEGYGDAIAGDTGGDIKGNRIDLFMPTRGEALEYGRRQIKVRVKE